MSLHMLYPPEEVPKDAFPVYATRVTAIVDVSYGSGHCVNVSIDFSFATGLTNRISISMADEPSFYTQI